MDANTKGLAADRLRAAKRELDVRRRLERNPAELWMLAAEAAADLGVRETGRQLQVNAERLEVWVAQLWRLGGPNGPKEVNGSAGAQSVELAPLPREPHAVPDAVPVGSVRHGVCHDSRACGRLRSGRKSVI
ncbi:MAG: hypothetical protein KJ000_32015 [Pirellulaceae bacterium]|nr:hypothetical protein [Pirellulaceae bacterium]